MLFDLIMFWVFNKFLDSLLSPENFKIFQLSLYCSVIYMA